LFLYRIDLYEDVLTNDESKESKYLYSVCSMAIRYMKQKSYTENHNLHKKKNSSRFISYPEIKHFMKAYGYTKLNITWYNKILEKFKKSSFVQSANTIGLVLAPKVDILSTHSLYASIIINPKIEQYNNFRFNKFIELSVKFLYGKPQATKFHKYGSLGVQPQGQTSVADSIGITQSRVQQIVKNNKKLYLFTKVTEHDKKSAAYFRNAYVYTIKNTGVNKQGEYRKPTYMKLIGTKFLGTLNYKSFVRGSTKLQPNIVSQRRLVNLSNNTKSEYKLASPKQHSMIDKIGFLEDFKTNLMSHQFGVNSSSTRIKTYQIVSTNKAKALKKLNTSYRVEQMYKDIESVQKDNRIFDSLSYSKHITLDKQYNSTSHFINKLYAQLIEMNKNAQQCSWLYKNANTMRYFIEDEIRRVKRHRAFHKKRKDAMPKKVDKYEEKLKLKENNKGIITVRAPKSK